MRRAHRLAVRTPPSHGGNRGSIPLGRANSSFHCRSLSGCGSASGAHAVRSGQIHHLSVVIARFMRAIHPPDLGRPDEPGDDDGGWSGPNSTAPPRPCAGQPLPAIGMPSRGNRHAEDRPEPPIRDRPWAGDHHRHQGDAARRRLLPDPRRHRRRRLGLRRMRRPRRRPGARRDPHACQGRRRGCRIWG